MLIMSSCNPELTTTQIQDIMQAKILLDMSVDKSRPVASPGNIIFDAFALRSGGVTDQWKEAGRHREIKSPPFIHAPSATTFVDQNDTLNRIMCSWTPGNWLGKLLRIFRVSRNDGLIPNCRLTPTPNQTTSDADDVSATSSPMESSSTPCRSNLLFRSSCVRHFFSTTEYIFLEPYFSNRQLFTCLNNNFCGYDGELSLPDKIHRWL
jgi:hypothetical protein